MSTPFSASWASVLASSVSLLPSSAAACPDCSIGRAARAQVLGPELWTNLAIALLPFAIVTLVCLRVERL